MVIGRGSSSWSSTVTGLVVGPVGDIACLDSLLDAVAVFSSMFLRGSSGSRFVARRGRFGRVLDEMGGGASSSDSTSD